MYKWTLKYENGNVTEEDYRFFILNDRKVLRRFFFFFSFFLSLSSFLFSGMEASSQVADGNTCSSLPWVVLKNSDRALGLAVSCLDGVVCADHNKAVLKGAQVFARCERHLDRWTCLIVCHGGLLFLSQVGCVKFWVYCQNVIDCFGLAVSLARLKRQASRRRTNPQPLRHGVASTQWPLS